VPRTRTPATALALALAALALVAGCAGAGAETPPQATEFTRGPYLTRVTETTATLRWIAAGDAPVALTARAGDGDVVRADGGSFAGLAPGTRYRWSAEVGGREAAAGTFVTAPRDLAEPLEFVVFGDYGAPNETSRAVAGLAAAERPRLLVTAGDNTYLVALPELLDEQIFGPLRDVLAHAPNYGVVGDHDIVIPAGRRALVEAFDWPGGGERYELRYGPVQIIGLGLRADDHDVAFVERALARPGPSARFLTMHQPIHAGNPLLPVIARSDVTAVLAGHLHAYERRERPEAPGVPFLTVGTGGAPRNDGATPRSPDARVHVAEFGLMRVLLHGTRATYTFVDVAGRVRDRLVRPLSPGGPPPP
jgi:hypothetical protein